MPKKRKVVNFESRVAVLENDDEDDLDSPLDGLVASKPTFKNVVGTKALLGALRGFVFGAGALVANAARAVVTAVSPPKEKFSLTALDISEVVVDNVCKSLAQQGSRSYTRLEKLLVVRAVFRALQLDIVEKEAVYNAMHPAGARTRSQDPEEFIDHDSPMTLRQAVDLASSRLGIGSKIIREWVYEYHQTGDIKESSRANSGLLLIETMSTCTPPYQIEILETFFVKKSKGERLNVTIIQIHLNSNVRNTPEFKADADLCPRALVSKDVIQTVLTRLGAFSFGCIHRTGKLGNAIDLDAKLESRRWAIRVYFVVYHQDYMDEKAGLVCQSFQDESFINLMHSLEFSLREIDEMGKVLAGLSIGNGKGPRLCFELNMHRCPFLNGYFVTLDADGNWVYDCDYQNSKGESVEKFGRFVELNRSGKPRDIFASAPRGAAATTAQPIHDTEGNPVAQLLSLKVLFYIFIFQLKDVTYFFTKALKMMKVSELKDEASYRGILSTEERPLNRRDDLINAINASRTCAEVLLDTAVKPKKVVLSNPMEASLLQTVTTDFKEIFKSYRDIALTCIRNFEANKAVGDYHLNYDTLTFYKSMCVLSEVYPVLCMQIQRALDSGALPADNPWYDWENKRPTRTLVTNIDNAPYHHGVLVQLQSKSKVDIAEILRIKGIAQIQYLATDAEGNETTPWAQVPAEGQTWERAKPSTEQLRAAVFKILQAESSNLVEPPWKALVDSKRDAWGPPDRPGWIVRFNVPFTSPFVAVEHCFSYGKNFVGAPEQCFEGRSFAQIIKLLRNRWLSPGSTKCSAFFGASERAMNIAIELDHANGGPLSGRIGVDLQGIPSPEELRIWKQRAELCHAQDDTTTENNTDAGNDDIDRDFI